MSAPAEKSVPAPRTTSTFTAGSSARPSRSGPNCAHIAAETALRLPGFSITSVATAPVASTRTAPTITPP